MSLLAQAKITEDNYIVIRAKACAAREGIPDPHVWVMTHIWELAASDGWAEAYASVLDGEVITDPAAWAGAAGADPNVISDIMIIDAVQRVRTAELAAVVASETPPQDPA